VDHTTPCRVFAVPEVLTIAKCCGTDCDSLGGTPALRPREAAALPAPAAPRDVTAVKKSNIFQTRQEECVWNSPGVRRGVGATQILTNSLSCPATNAESCPNDVTVSLSVSSTNTFGVSTEVSASFFEIVSASVSFSYEYSYTEETSYSTTYGVNISPGSSGYLTFTPELECSDGHFEGPCSFTADGDGTVCIPRYVTAGTGEPAGVYNFVTELSP
jgi:hypothetical protein